MKFARPWLSALVLAAALYACADNPATPAPPQPATPDAPRASAAAGTLQWFGYASSGNDEPALIGTDSYTNWGEFITDENASSTAATTEISALSRHNLRAVVDLGKLLWYPPYTNLYGNYVDRWNTWKQANAAVLTSANVIAFIIHDEPFTNSVNMYEFQAASALVKHDFPWASLILIEAAETVTCQEVWCNFPKYAGLVSTVDWIGVDRYAIDPRTDETFRYAVSIMKATYPGRKMVYVADGYWDQTHSDNLGTTTLYPMRDVTTWWFDVARADPDAVMLATFLWNPLEGATSSRDFTPYVLDEQTRVGRVITGRTFTHQYAATGTFSVGSDGVVTGWACDPDGAWGEVVVVRTFMDGAPYSAGTAGEQDGLSHAACRSGGTYHGIRVPLGIGTIGHRITATVQDLDGNQIALATTCKDAPACVWYRNNYLPTGTFLVTSSGLVSGWACDKDAPTLSIQVKILAGSGTVVGVYPANLASDATVNTQCGGGTAHGYSVQLPAWTKGQTITVYGLDTMEGSRYLSPQGTARSW